MSTTQFKTNTARNDYASVSPELVLVVEDDPFAVRLLSRLINEQLPQSAIHSCDNFAAATKLLSSNKERNQIRLVVSDILINGPQNGIDVYDYCKAHFPDVPFVMTSVVPEEKFFSMMSEGSSLRPPHFMAKPYSIYQCRALLKSILA